MYGFATDVSMGWDRTPLHGGSAREDACLVDALVATRDERERALAPSMAAAWLRWCGLSTSDALVDRLEAGRVLLVLRTLAPAGDTASAPLDLRDFTDAVPLSPPVTEEDEEVEEELTFIDVVVLDARGEPRANVLYELVLPDATVFTGRTGPDGRLRLDGLTQRGDCELTFPEAVAA